MIVTRRCLRADCFNVFEAPEESETRYCSTCPDPIADPPEAPKKVWEDGNDVANLKRHRKLSDQDRKRVKEIIRDGILKNQTQREMAARINAEKIERASGGPFKYNDVMNYVYQVRRELHKEEKRVRASSGNSGGAISDVPDDRFRGLDDNGGPGVPSDVASTSNPRPDQEQCNAMEKIEIRAMGDAAKDDLVDVRLGGQPSGLVVAILMDEKLDDTQKVAMLKIYCDLT